MKEINLTFLEKIERTGTVKSFRFSTNEKIDFVPGQFLQVIFDEGDRSNKDLNKYLSFSSSPTKNYVEFTKRISDSEFSKRLDSLQTGSRLLIKAPLGGCVFIEAYKKISFLIGGIGITPVISILEYIVDKKIDTDVQLFYSNRRDDDIAFRESLDTWQKSNGNIKIAYLVSDCSPKDSRCLFGQIDKKIVNEKTQSLKERIFYIFGPPRMVEAMKVICQELGCDKDKIKTESFIGY